MLLAMHLLQPDHNRYREEKKETRITNYNYEYACTIEIESLDSWHVLFSHLRVCFV